MSKRKRQEMRCFRAPRRRFDAFVSGRDVAVRSMHVFLAVLHGSGGAVDENVFSRRVFSQFLHIKSDKIFPYVLPRFCREFFGILLGDLIFNHVFVGLRR